MVQTMITVAQAQAQVDALLAAQQGGMLSVSIAGRTVTYRSLKDLTEALTYWTRVLAQAKRVQSGASRHGYAAADFRGSR
jgi:hypothetical protein